LKQKKFLQIGQNDKGDCVLKDSTSHEALRAARLNSKQWRNTKLADFVLV